MTSRSMPPLARRGRQAMPRRDVVLIKVHGFVIALELKIRLSLKTGRLIHGVVQLRKAVGILPAADDNSKRSVTSEFLSLRRASGETSAGYSVI